VDISKAVTAPILALLSYPAIKSKPTKLKMKTSNVLASVLFGSLAAAAPLNKRAYATVTHTFVETVVVYTTVWDGEAPAAPATSAAGLFFEEHSKATPSSAAASSTPIYTPPAAKSSSVYTPPAVETSAPAPSPTSVYTPPVVSTPSPAPEPSSVYTPPPVASSTVAAPAPVSSSTGGGGSGSGGSGQTYTGSITMYYYGGGTGACGEPISDTEMVVALGVAEFGDSSYDVMTGLPTNKWCGVTIAITYNGVTTNGKIMDRCPGCTEAGLDMTPALWEKVTGGVGGASGDRLSGATWQVVS
jgi:hypothetical protein